MVVYSTVQAMISVIIKSMKVKKDDDNDNDDGDDDDDDGDDDDDDNLRSKLQLIVRHHHIPSVAK